LLFGTGAIGSNLKEGFQLATLITRGHIEEKKAAAKDLSKK